MVSKFLANFFRCDLNLKEKWWHRFFVVFFVMALLLGLLSVWDTSLPKYAEVDTLNNRMSTEPMLLPELISSQEKIELYENNLYGSWYDKNMGWALRQPDVYCARNIAQHIEKISTKTGVTIYKGNGPEELLSLQNFKSYISNQEANCIYITTLNDQRIIAWAWFVSNDYKVWGPSIFTSVLYGLTGSLIVLLWGLITIILYYKVFLYVLFDRKKID